MELALLAVALPLVFAGLSVSFTVVHTADEIVGEHHLLEGGPAHWHVAALMAHLQAQGFELECEQRMPNGIFRARRPRAAVSERNLLSVSDFSNDMTHLRRAFELRKDFVKWSPGFGQNFYALQSFRLRGSFAQRGLGAANIQAK